MIEPLALIRRASAVVALAGLLVLSAATSALAADVSITSPRANEAVSGITTIVVKESGGGLLGGQPTVTLTVTPSAGGQARSVPVTSAGGGRFEGSWDTRAHPTNGAYNIKAESSGGGLLGGAGGSTTVSNVLVNNPPAAPSGVRAALQDGVPVVTWTAGREADLKGYRVFRSSDGGDYSLAGSPSGPSFRDSSAPAGVALRYEVAAVRSSPVNAAGIEGRSGATPPVTIPAPQAAQGPAGAGSPASQPAADLSRGVQPVAGAPLIPSPNAPPAKNLKSAPLAPIIRSGPNVVDFQPTLPFPDAAPPQQFDTASGNPSPIAGTGGASGLSGNLTTADPTRFIAAGLLMLVASAHLAKAARRLLRAPRSPGPAEVSSNRVPFPAFRINRA